MIKILTLVIGLASSILLSGCSMKAESKLEYYELVQTLPYESIETFRNSGSRIKIQEYVDSTVHMIQFAYAEILDDNTLKISTYSVRSDLESLIVARSNYFYKEAGKKLALYDYEASQKSIIGEWRIPTLDTNDISQRIKNILSEAKELAKQS